MKAAIASVVGVLGIGGLLLAGSRYSSSVEASRTSAATEASRGPVLLNCGEGHRALVRPVSLNGQTVSQVECVGLAAAPSVERFTDFEPEPYRQNLVADAPRSTPAVYRTAARTTARPAVRRAVYREPVRREGSEPEVRRMRSWKKSAIIIGASAGAGAGVGAIIKGRKGAAVGAAIGGVAGTVYDIATRNK